MTRYKLILRNLRHFRLANLAVVAGTLVATAVLTGALMVGDSVRGSLRDLSLRRLGPVDHALQSSRFFPQDLAQRIERHPDFAKQFQAAAPAILVNGGVSRKDSQQTLRTTAQIGAMGKWIEAERGKVLVNTPLRSALSLADVNAPLELSVPAVSDTPRDAALARRSAQDVTVPFSSRVGAFSPTDSFASHFTLGGNQRDMPLAWMTLADLQDAMEQPRRINAILVQGAGGAEQAAVLNRILREVDAIEDHGLSLGQSADKSEAVLNSASTYITPAVLDAARATAEAIQVPLREASVYLINNVISGDKRIHYAIAAGMNRVDDQPLRDDEVILNQWTADRLAARPGDVIRLDFYKRKSDGTLAEVSSADAGVSLRVARVIPMSGVGADASLTPVYKGLTDASSVANWEAPEGLHIDKKLVSKDDEAYWEEHKAAPKLFVTLKTAERLWGSAFGVVNSVRVPAEKRKAFETELLNRIDPAATGLGFRPVKAEALDAAVSGTDFSGLFIGLSFFIIVAAAMLVAMLFRLAIEQRARQFGLLGALGFTPATLRKLALVEGMLLALLGSVLGVLGAVGYTALIMAGLRTWWVGAVGTTALQLHIVPLTLIIGLVASLLVAGAALLFAVWRLGRSEAVQLLSGGWSRGDAKRGSRALPLAAITALAGLLLGVAMVAAGLFNLIKAEAAFVGGGALLLIGLIAASSSWLGASHRRETRSWSLASLGSRNAGRNRGRSVLTIGLIAFASFVLVAVSAFKQSPPSNPDDRAGGTGGFRLILTAQNPLSGDLNLKSGRELLGMSTTQSPLLDQAKFVSMRSWAGQDMSCLNLTRPTAPTILAVPDALTQRTPFNFSKTIEKTDRPWSLLDRHRAGAIPVIADHEAATYILKKGVGDIVELTDQAGRPRRLIIVATLAHCIFQSELLMSEKDFLQLFPSQSGFGTVLVETNTGDQEKLSQLLSSELGDFAVTVEPTATRLARYQQVANTYISTFQTLGSLGLLLGTIGLAVILLRGLVERRAELALLSAIGFAPGRRLALVLSENTLLLLLGLGIGTLCALVGVAPAIWGGRSLNLLQLGLTLLLVLLTGMTVLVIAVWAGSRRIGPADLRGE